MESSMTATAPLRLRSGNGLDSSATCFTDRNIDIEYPLEALCPGHRGVTMCGCAVICITVFLALVACSGHFISLYALV